jgi:hypothetical protein
MVFAGNLGGYRHPSLPACPAEVASAYVPSVGSPPLRFLAEPIVAPAPAPSITKETIATPKSNDFIPPANDHPGAADSMAVDPTGNKGPEAQETPVATKGRTPAPILPDNTRPTVHPEDFLPFFQFPLNRGQTGEVNVIMPLPPAPPTPSGQPASSATYIQTPR